MHGDDKPLLDLNNQVFAGAPELLVVVDVEHVFAAVLLLQCIGAGGVCGQYLRVFVGNNYLTEAAGVYLCKVGRVKAVLQHFSAL